MAEIRDGEVCPISPCVVVRRHHTHEDSVGRMWCCGSYPYSPAAPSEPPAEAPFGVNLPSILRILRAAGYTVMDPPAEAQQRDEPLHEVECPSCGATIRARMADAPDLLGGPQPDGEAGR